MYTKLISVETRARFDTIQNSQHPFPNQSLVIIEDTQQVWTHGVFISNAAIDNNLKLTIAGTDYDLPSYFLKKNEDIDLGLHDVTNQIYQESYSIKADTHKILQYTTRTGNYNGLHIGSTDDQVIIDSKYSLYRLWSSGAQQSRIPILDTSNVSISNTTNELTYNFGGLITGTLYFAQHDQNNTAPQNLLGGVSTRLGGNASEGWIVMNTGQQGTASTYYQLRIVNGTSPELYMKGTGNTFTKLLTASDIVTWTGATDEANGTAGYMPAPTSAQRGQFLRGDGQWVTLNNYELPVATSSALGGVKVGTTLVDDTGYTKVFIKDDFIYFKDTTYTFYNLQFQNVADTNIAVYTPSTGTNKTILAGSNVNFSVTGDVITLNAVDTWSAWQPAGAAAEGVAGIYPAPGATNYLKFLRGDGTWCDLNNYSLPVATDSSLGGVKVGTTLTDDAGYTKVHIKDQFIYYKDTTYNFYNLAFYNGDTLVDTYKPTTSPSKVFKATGNVSISASNNVISINSTNTQYYLTLNNSIKGTANTTNLGTIYAPTSNGTGFLKGTAGDSGAITWNWDNSTYVPTSDYPLTTIQKTLTLSKQTWTDTGIAGNNLSTGTYAVQLYIHIPSPAYWVTYSAIMSWYADNTNGSVAEELALHGAGHAINYRMYLRTVETSNGSGGMKLQIACDEACSSATYTFKFRKLI